MILCILFMCYSDLDDAALVVSAVVIQRSMKVIHHGTHN